MPAVESCSVEVTPLDRAIHDYLTRLDAGESVSREAFLADHTELNHELAAFFETSDLVRRMSGTSLNADETSIASRATAVTLDGEATHSSSVETRGALSPVLPGPFPVTLGSYRVLGALGRGAMGEVYLAEDLKLGRRVALKLPQPRVAESHEQLSRFAREARAAAGLRHHNICPVYEVNEIGGVHYIAMAYIEGKSLADHIREGAPGTPRQIAELVRKMAAALDFAHRAGVVHRDLKPANVMIDADGEPIVMDFGLARIATDEPSGLTHDGMLVGTPAYMAPEQVRSELDRVGPASDVYSLGVILYELLTGRLPFNGPMMTILMDVANEERIPPRPSEVRSGVDPTLEALCLRMLAKPLSTRCGSMREVAAALTEFLARPETSDLKSGIPQLRFAAPPGSSRRSRALALAGMGGLILAGVIVITIRNRDGSQTTIKVPDSSEINISREGDDPSARPASRPSWHGWPADGPKPAIAPFDAAQAKRHQEEWAAHLRLPVEYANSIGMKFRLIPPGEFLMGSPAEEIEAALKTLDPFTTWEDSVRSEAPRHRVVLTKPIYLGIHEVTRAEYDRVMGTMRVEDAGTSTYPIENVSLNDAAEFCAKLSQQEKLRPSYFRAGATVTTLDGDGYRLPTEAAWEFACRAGTTTRYWSGDKEDDVGRIGWLARNSGNRPHAVGELRANPFGLYDMHGNLYEWVHDEWDPAWYGRSRDQPAIDPTAPIGGDRPIFRGGYWGDAPLLCRAALRKVGEREYRGIHIGFRVALPATSARPPDAPR